MRKNSIKNTRINGEVQKELSSIIRGEIKDPRIHPMTSVMAVEVAPDLKTCKAYISVLGNQEAKEATIRGLNSAEEYIRRQQYNSQNHKTVHCPSPFLFASFFLSVYSIYKKHRKERHNHAIPHLLSATVTF